MLLIPPKMLWLAGLGPLLTAARPEPVMLTPRGCTPVAVAWPVLDTLKNTVN